MTIRLLLFVTALWSFAGSKTGQERMDPFQAHLYVGDANVVVTHLLKEQLLNGDVAVIASVTCSSMRTALQDELPQKMSIFLAASYPGANQLERLTTEDLLSYEITAFKEFGATSQTLDLLQAELKEKPGFPTHNVGVKDRLEPTILGLETQACALRRDVSPAISEPAPTEVANTARLLGKGTLAVAAMAVDAAAVIYAPYLAVTMVSFASGGWG